jgi:hypothetical protein
VVLCHIPNPDYSVYRIEPRKPQETKMSVPGTHEIMNIVCVVLCAVYCLSVVCCFV